MSTFEVTKMSSKGQIVIPTEIRKELSLKEGSKLIVMAHRGKLLMTPMDAPTADSFKDLIKESRKVGKKLKKTDVKDAIKKTRRRS